MTSYWYKPIFDASECNGRASQKFNMGEGPNPDHYPPRAPVVLPPLPKSAPPKPKAEREPYSIDYHGLVFLWRWNEHLGDLIKPTWFMRD